MNGVPSAARHRRAKTASARGFRAGDSESPKPTRRPRLLASPARASPVLVVAVAASYTDAHTSAPLPAQSSRALVASRDSFPRALARASLRPPRPSRASPHRPVPRIVIRSSASMPEPAPDANMYDSLGVSSDATSTEIRRAYRNLITKVRASTISPPPPRDGVPSRGDHRSRDATRAVSDPTRPVLTAT
jgi:hypothetical protein